VLTGLSFGALIVGENGDRKLRGSNRDVLSHQDAYKLCPVHVATVVSSPNKYGCRDIRMIWMSLYFDYVSL
jgi:hypothetical protein